MRFNIQKLIQSLPQIYQTKYKIALKLFFLYLSVNSIVRCSIQVKEIRQKISSTAEDFLQLEECSNSFFINKIIDNEEFLLTSQLMSSYEFHKLKDEQSSMMRIGDTIIVLDSSFRFLKLNIKYNNSTNIKSDQIKIISGGSYDLKIINQTNQIQNDANNIANQKNQLQFKLLDSQSSDFVFIWSGKKVYKIDLDNPLESIVKGNHLHYFQDNQKIEDVVYYKFQSTEYNIGYFFVAQNGSVYIYQQNLDINFQLKYLSKMKGLQYDLLHVSMMQVYNDLLLVVDQKVGIFIFGLPNNTTRSEIQRLPLYIEASDVVDVLINDNSIVVVESEDSNSMRVIITEYFYNIETSTVYEVKELIQRYSNYQTGSLTSSKFYFISNFAIHYINLLQNFSKSVKAVSSVFDSDDFYFNEDKILTNTESIRIHNFLVFDNFKNFSAPLLIGLENKKINAFALEHSPPSVEIKYNDEQLHEESDQLNQQQIESQSTQERENEKNEANIQKKKYQKLQLTATCAVFDCSNYEKYLNNLVQNGLQAQNSFSVSTQTINEQDIMVFKDFCIITTEIDFIDQEDIPWIQLLIKNPFLYYGLLSSIVFIPIIYFIIRFIFSIKCKFQFNVDIFTKDKKKNSVKQDHQCIMDLHKVEDNQNGIEQYQIEDEITQEIITQEDLKIQQQDIHVKQIDNQKTRIKKLGVYSVGNTTYQQNQKKQHQQTASEYSKNHITNPPNFLKEKVKLHDDRIESQKSISTKASQKQISMKSSKRTISTKESQNSVSTKISQKQNYQNLDQPEEAPQILQTEIIMTDVHLQTEGDDKPLFKKTKLLHED